MCTATHTAVSLCVLEMYRAAGRVPQAIKSIFQELQQTSTAPTALKTNTRGVGGESGVRAVEGEGKEVGRRGQGLEGQRWTREYDTFNEKRSMGRKNHHNHQMHAARPSAGEAIVPDTALRNNAAYDSWHQQITQEIKGKLGLTYLPSLHCLQTPPRHTL